MQYRKIQSLTTRARNRQLCAITAMSLLACASLPLSAQDGSSENQPAVDPATFEPITDWGTEDLKPKVHPNAKQITERVTQDQPEQNFEPMISFGVFSEPIELTTLIDYVGSSLNINIVIKGSPTGEIVFNAPIQVPRSKLIDLLDAMLEQYAFTISYEPDSKFYIVQPLTDLKPSMGTDRATTRIIPTPNIKPSLLVTALNATLGTTTGTNAANKAGAIQAVDELGVLIVNAPPRDIRRVEQMVEEFIRLDDDQQYIRFELDHLSAPTALDRAVGLVGGSSSSQGSAPRVNQNNGQPSAIPSTGSSLSNLSERITIDPQGNALIFKGTESEIGRVRKVLSVIDVPNTLTPKNYFAGSSAGSIADIAKGRGLGEVILIESQSDANPFNSFGNQNQQFGQQVNNVGQGGPVMVVDTERGSIIYYGTDDQQAQLSALLKELKTDDERIAREIYKLDHTDALVMEDLLNGIMFGESQTGESDLLQGTAGRNNNNRGFFGGVQFGEGDASSFDPNEITITAYEDANQIIIRAPINQQSEIEKLINDLDVQRSQVYIQAMIVSVADNEDFTLAFETQINAGQYSAATNFGLSSAGDTFTDPRNVASNLGGLTQAVIMSEYVPIIVNATQTNTEARILSRPQLLVNDNVESTIMSTEEQPYSEVTQGTNGGDSLEGLGGYVEVGTTLTVTPSISSSGFVRLEYSVELSNFVGIAQEGLPPGTNRRTLEGTVSVPSDATIVIGGITVDDIRDTVLKVPLLGDIPLLGELFKRTNNVNNKSKLYVFLTPRIMTDPNFNDLKLLSQGPQSDMDLEDSTPSLEPELILAPGHSTVLPPAPANFDPEPSYEEMSNQLNNSSSTSSSSNPPSLEPELIEISDALSKDSE